MIAVLVNDRRRVQFTSTMPDNNGSPTDSTATWDGYNWETITSFSLTACEPTLPDIPLPKVTKWERVDILPIKPSAALFPMSVLPSRRLPRAITHQLIGRRRV